jgi:hypothetical protein
MTGAPRDRKHATEDLTTIEIAAPQSGVVYAEGDDMPTLLGTTGMSSLC